MCAFDTNTRSFDSPQHLPKRASKLKPLTDQRSPKPVTVLLHAFPIQSIWSALVRTQITGKEIEQTRGWLQFTLHTCLHTQASQSKSAFMFHPSFARQSTNSSQRKNPQGMFLNPPKREMVNLLKMVMTSVSPHLGQLWKHSLVPPTPDQVLEVASYYAIHCTFKK